jgi:small GTP-binding protein
MNKIKGVINSIFNWKIKDPKFIVLLGLDAAGKTTFLYRIRNPDTDEVITRIPTIGFAVETLQVKDIHFTCWDIGGCDKIRPLWQHYIQGIGGIVFMIDAADFDRIEPAREEMMYFLNQLDSSLPLLVIANKMDIPRARSLEEIIKGLQLDTVTNRQWEIIPAIMTLKEYAKPCLKWIHSVLYDEKKEKKSTCDESTISEQYDGISSCHYFKNEGLMKTKGKDTAENFMKEITERTNAMKETEVLASVPSLNENESSPGVDINNEKPIQQLVQDHDQQKLDLVWKDWLSSSLNDSDTREKNYSFLQQLYHYNLPKWDHYTHIRIAYLLIAKYGLEDGFANVEKVLSEYIEKNTIQTNGKTFHLTMTRFWCHLVGYWMIRFASRHSDLRMSNDYSPASSSAVMMKPENEGATESDHLQPSDDVSRLLSTDQSLSCSFHTFLQFVYDNKIIETNITQATLFKTYYSSSRIFSGEAKTEILSPDLLSLPVIPFSITDIHESVFVNQNIKFFTNNKYWEKIH